MPQHQLALGQRRQLDLDGRRERRIGRRRQLVHVHAAEDRRAGVADDAALHLRAELLRGEEHQAEIPPALGEVEQHLPDIGVGAIGRGVLVQLIDEHDHVVDAEVAALEVLAQLGDAAREDQVLGERVDAGHVHHVDGAVLELAPGKVVGRAVVDDESLGAGADVAEAVPHLPDRGDVMRAPHLAARDPSPP